MRERIFQTSNICVYQKNPNDTIFDNIHANKIIYLLQAKRIK